MKIKSSNLLKKKCGLRLPLQACLIFIISWVNSSCVGLVTIKQKEMLHNNTGGLKLLDFDTNIYTNINK